MISPFFEFIGIFFQLFGAIYVISNKIQFLWNVVKKTYPFKQIDKGLEKLNWKTLDVKLPDVYLWNYDEGFKEIFNIINERFGPYPKDVDAIYFTPLYSGRTIETSIFSVVLVKFNNGKEYEIYPTTRRDLLLRIDFWEERLLILIGFISIFFGTLFQLISIIIRFL